MPALLDSLILIVRWSGKDWEWARSRAFGACPIVRDQTRRDEPETPEPSEAHCHRHFPTLSAAKAICKRQQICDSFQ